MLLRASTIGLLASGCGAWTTTDPATGPRPSAWATAVERTSLPNLHRVSDVLYRGAQPDEAGFAELKALGIKTVVNLRAFHSDRSETGARGLGYEHISMKAWHPEDEDVHRFLRVVTDPTKTPIFVHCQHGADRTGVMTAIYRIVVEGWSKEEAIDEMTQGGFGFHSIWTNLVDYVRDLDVDHIKSLTIPAEADGPTDGSALERSRTKRIATH
ncbi:MAG: dual specificity protein phosphatase family protein [Deltaproteobacteria bacterium]|nr:dual specificity protein phosphatase family protein [Deltaproteobacteria bacterium]